MSIPRATTTDPTPAKSDADIERLFALISEAKRLARALDHVTVSYLLDFALVDLKERVELPKKERAPAPRRKLARRRLV
ncbi:MAG TPA: hypothetical protein VKV77_10270 [Methylovirgula sp.]|nr:hypothetical protein [Methylovirgula sp.]